MCELLRSGVGVGWGFCNFLLNAGVGVAIAKQGVRHRSENFEK